MPRSESIINAITGMYNQPDRLVFQESMGQITPSDPRGVSEQLDGFRGMKDGWLDGNGLAPNHAGLDWLDNAFASLYPAHGRLPYVYPTPKGGVQLEWSLGPNEVSLEIDHRSIGCQGFGFEHSQCLELVGGTTQMVGVQTSVNSQTLILRQAHPTLPTPRR